MAKRQVNIALIGYQFMERRIATLTGKSGGFLI